MQPDTCLPKPRLIRLIKTKFLQFKKAKLPTSEEFIKQRLAQIKTIMLLGHRKNNAMHLLPKELRQIIAKMLYLVDPLDVSRIHINRKVVRKNGMLSTLDLGGMQLESIDNLEKVKIIDKCHILDLDNNLIKAIRRNTFTSFRHLQHLILGNNHVSCIEPYAFASLKHLQVLKLDNAYISTLSSRTFAGLLSLRQLVLRNNKITCLPAELFQDLINLEWLSLNNNPIEHIHHTIFLPLLKLNKLTLPTTLSKNLRVQVENEVPKMCDIIYY